MTCDGGDVWGWSSHVVLCVYMRGSRCGMNTCHEEAPFLYWCAIFLVLEIEISCGTVVFTRIVYTGTRTIVLVCVQMFILYAIFRTLSLRYVRTVLARRELGPNVHLKSSFKTQNLVVVIKIKIFIDCTNLFHIFWHLTQLGDAISGNWKWLYLFQNYDAPCADFDCPIWRSSFEKY